MDDRQTILEKLIQETIVRHFKEQYVAQENIRDGIKCFTLYLNGNHIVAEDNAGGYGFDRCLASEIVRTLELEQQPTRPTSPRLPLFF